jgi:ribosomal protein S18 acetylase RimI-like enzyme
LEKANFSLGTEYNYEKIVDILKQDFCKIYGCFSKSEQLIGYCILTISDKIDIDKICVNDKYRKLGFATKLLNFINYMYFGKKIILEVSTKNENAIKFYEKNEFKKINLRKNYYKDNSDAIIFEK